MYFRIIRAICTCRRSFGKGVICDMFLSERKINSLGGNALRRITTVETLQCINGYYVLT